MKHGWEGDKQLARSILRDRSARRKVIGRMLLLALGVMAAGLWLIGDWLAGDPWRFLFWWGGCALIVGMVILFALYDALAVIREEREKHR